MFSLRSFPEVGQKQKTEKEKKRGKNDGNNNGQKMAYIGHRNNIWYYYIPYIGQNVS